MAKSPSHCFGLNQLGNSHDHRSGDAKNVLQTIAIFIKMISRKAAHSLKIKYRVHRTSVPKAFDVLNSASFND